MRNLAQSLGIGLGKTHSNEEIQFVFKQVFSILKNRNTVRALLVPAGTIILRNFW